MFEIKPGDVLVVDGVEKVVDSVYALFSGYGVDTDDGETWNVFESHEDAGQAARDYWEDLCENDPKEAAAILGEETLVAWALRQFAGPGSTQVQSLEEWLDLWLDTPEEEWAGYDGAEWEATLKVCDEDAEEAEDEDGLPIPVFSEELDCVAYRHN